MVGVPLWPEEEGYDSWFPAWLLGNPGLGSPWWPLLPLAEERCIPDRNTLTAGGPSGTVGHTEPPGRSAGALSPRCLPVLHLVQPLK